MRILFVCHGNICRSPMAEFIMKDMLERQGISDCVQVASCATSREEIWNGVGNPVYPPAKQELARHGISCYGKRAVQLTAQDYEKYDLLVGMDNANIRNMQRITGGDPEGKMRRLMEYAGEDADVADPWYTDRFDVAYCDIARGCEALLRYVCERTVGRK
jgi:protein-tyrosine phosphatase